MVGRLDTIVRLCTAARLGVNRQIQSLVRGPNWYGRKEQSLHERRDTSQVPVRMPDVAQYHQALGDAWEDMECGEKTVQILQDRVDEACGMEHLEEIAGSEVRDHIDLYVKNFLELLGQSQWSNSRTS